MAFNSYDGTNNTIGNDFYDNTLAPHNTSVWLLAGVPLDSDQNDQIWFESKSAQENYFMGGGISDVQKFSNTSYVNRDNQTLRFSLNGQVGSAETAIKYNYMIFQNADYGDHYYYAFITNISYVNYKTFDIKFKIDVFQTWLFDIKFQQSYVRRMMLPEWKSRTIDSGFFPGTMDVPYQRNQEENLDYGKDYETVYQVQVTAEKDARVHWLVIVAKEALEEKESISTAEALDPSSDVVKGFKYYGSLAGGVPTPLHYYLLPYNTANSKVLSTPVFEKKTMGDARALMYMLAKSNDLANKVVSITTTDWCPVMLNGTYDDGYSGKVIVSGTNRKNAISVSLGKDPTAAKTDTDTEFRIIKATELGRTGHRKIDIGNVYKPFKKYDSSKMLNSPYSVVELTDYKGHNMIIKPEYVYLNHLIINVMTGLSWQPKVGYEVMNYQVSEGADQIETDTGLYIGNMENAIYDINSNDIPVVTSQLATYMQSQKNSISQTKTNSMIDAFKGVGNGLISGAMSGVPAVAAGNALLGGINGAVSSYEKNAMLNAKQEDIKNTPPNLNGLGNNPIFDNNNNIAGFYLIWKQPKEEYARKLEDSFKMYGYNYNRLVDLSDFSQGFHSRTKWNYIETRNISIVGHINNQDMNELQNIFNSGVTLWHGTTPGDYSGTNSEV